MKRLLTAVVAVSALALSATAANAAVTIILPGAPIAPGSDPTTTFIVSGNIFSGPIVATIGHTGIPGPDAGNPTGSFTDIFNFTIPQTGTGSGSITTSVNFGDFLGSTDLDIDSVVVNGLAAIQTLTDINGIPCLVEGVGTCGAGETFARNDVPITSGVLNSITVTGTSRGLGSYGGNLTFIPAPVPEPATWAMMILGFGAVGWQIRRRTRPTLAQAA